MTAPRPSGTAASPPATDAALVQRTLAGDREAWGELYLRFRRLVARELGRVLWKARHRRREDLDEAIQEWWAYESLGILRQWRPEVAQLSTYLTIRVHGWGINYLKRLRPGYCGRGTSSRDPARIALARASTIPAEPMRPDEAFAAAEWRREVRRAATTTATTLRLRAVVMRWLDVDEPTRVDLARALGISPQAVSCYEARLLARLRPRLATLAA